MGARAQVSFALDRRPSKFNSLPRRRSATCEDAFTRHAPARRSAGAGAGAAGCVEYFVPRSLSEFNLSGGELYSLSLSSAGRGARGRDKMVTFEDDRGGGPGGGGPGGSLADDVFM